MLLVLTVPVIEFGAELDSVLVADIVVGSGAAFQLVSEVAFEAAFGDVLASAVEVVAFGVAVEKWSDVELQFGYVVAALVLFALEGVVG